MEQIDKLMNEGWKLVTIFPDFIELVKGDQRVRIPVERPSSHFRKRC